MFGGPVARTLVRTLFAVALLFGSMSVGVAPALAEVRASFHSFNGSLFGRYPHTFVVFEGTLDSTGEAVNENYGFSARDAGPGVLFGSAEHIVMSEEPRYVQSTNRHFTIPISDATYARMKGEIAAWRDQPGKYYHLDRRNCIHFVGRLAELAGLRVAYPEALLRKPRAWLNHVSDLNPHLNAAHFD